MSQKTSMDLVAASTGGKDYLSRLPNEIVQDIFDRSFSWCRPYGALSKKLLPFSERSLYSDLFIRNFKSFARLVRTLQSRPALSQLVTTLEILDYSTEIAGEQTIDHSSSQILLLSLLPNLRDFRTTWYLSLPPHSVPPSLSAALTTIRVPIITLENLEIDFGNAAKWISTLPSIDTLEFTNWHSFIELYDETLEISFPSVRDFTVTGQGAANPEVSLVVNACHPLESLCLFREPILEEEEESPEVSFDELLSNIGPSFATLTTLSLFSTMPNTVVGESLVSFVNLRHLNLDFVGGLPELHQSVLQLVNLVEFRVGCQDYDWNSLLELVQGRSRLVKLKYLSLDQIRFKEGRRFDPDDREQVSQFDIPIKEEEEEEEEEEERDMYEYLQGWTMRGMRLIGPQYWTEFDNFVRVARGAGIRLSGSVFKSRQVFLSYQLELNNLAVAEAFFNYYFDDLAEVRAEALRNGLNLPLLENTSEDPEDLELVKVPVPELEWFALTLRDKEIELAAEERE
ncbi:hypothetical protein JCM3765_006613 [Sporobolomyces pararoseus]